MKKIVILITILFIISCSSENKYEKLISDYAQTDRHGTWTDAQFKALEIKELEPLTVADSISILKTEFEKDRESKIRQFTLMLEMARKGLKKEENSKIKIQSLLDDFQKQVVDIEHMIDSIKGIEFTSIYDNEPSGKILLQPVQCRYSYVFPPEAPRQERTDIFYFIPDGTKITGQLQVNE